MIHCRYCENDHGDLLLCPPAKRVLDALYAQGQRFDLPTIEFPDPITGPGALGDNTVLVQNVVVKAAVMDVSGVARPVLIFTGHDIGGNVLPHWVHPASDDDLLRVSKLVADMTEMAIRRAKQQREGRHGADH